MIMWVSDIPIFFKSPDTALDARNNLTDFRMHVFSRGFVLVTNNDTKVITTY